MALSIPKSLISTQQTFHSTLYADVNRGDGFVHDKPTRRAESFDLGIHTPDNLNRGARVALLLNSPVIANGPVGISPRPGRTAQTQSSPLNAATAATAIIATEEAELANTSSIFKLRPVSIIESTNNLTRERVKEYNAKLIVFQAFYAKFEEAA